MPKEEGGKPPSRPILWDAEVKGFGVRVTANGKRTFVLVKRYPGSPHPTPREIGEYPTMTLAKARDEARAWVAMLKKGIDPAEHAEEENRKREEGKRKADAERANTFAAAFELFAARHLSGLRSGNDVEREMRRLLLPAWGPRPLREITRRDVITSVYAVHDGGKPIMANRLLSYAKKFFGWCIERDLVEDNPAASVKKQGREVKRDRTLTDGEIRSIWQACEGLGAFGRSVQLMLATAARKTVAGEARWSEIDVAAKVWRLDAARTKAERGHEIPLNGIALGILDAVPQLGPFIFSTDGIKPIGGWSKPKDALDAASGVIDWTLHDLRRTAATNLAKLGVDRVVISKILNHADPGVTAIYDRHARAPEMAAALAAWGRRLEQIIHPEAADNVVPLRQGRREAD